MLNRAILTFFAVFLANSLFGQSVIGAVKDANNEAVPFANVLLFNASDTSLAGTAITDTSGHFELKPPSDNGSYYLIIQSVGLTDYKSEIFNGGKVFEKIVMSSNTVELGAVSIVGSKPLVEKTGRGLIMNVASSPLLQNSSGLEILEKIPGSQVNEDGSVSIKGKQNVQVFIDGKPSKMSLEALKTYLENMPANEIEKVEVFEIPPAKFDASGTAGIINIVTKKGARLGTNGTLSTRAGYGNLHKLSNYAALNYRNKKFNAFGAGWFYNSMNDHLSTQDIKMGENQESSFFNSSHHVNHSVGAGGRAGIDVFLNEKTTLGYIGQFHNGGYRTWQPSTVVVSGPATSIYDYIDASQNSNGDWFWHNHNINLESKLDKNESLNFDFDFSTSTAESQNDNLNNYFLAENALTPYYVLQGSTRENMYGVGKVDYENILFSDWILEAGAKVSWVQTKNDFESFNGTSAKDITENLNASNVFNYNETIISAYSTLARKWGENWSADAGLRVEHTIASGESPNAAINFQRNYTNFFPNVSVSYSVPKKYNLSGAYTRRINRPSYWQLNPFQGQTNQFLFSQGNPDLQPEISDVATLTYGLKEAIYFTLSGSQMNGLMNQVLIHEEVLQRQVQITENLDKFENYSLNSYVPFKIKNWYSGNFNGTVYYNKMSSDFEWGFVGYEIFTFGVSMQHIFSLPQGYKLELSGFYNYDSYWNIWFVEPHYKIDFGISKSIGNFRFNLAVKDFLNIREGNGGVFQGDVNRATTYKPESRKAILSINYRFGNHKVKGARQRKTGSEDIQNRSSK